jgi:hypothetical protein
MPADDADTYERPRSPSPNEFGGFWCLTDEGDERTRSLKVATRVRIPLGLRSELDPLGQPESKALLPTWLTKRARPLGGFRGSCALPELSAAVRPSDMGCRRQ